MTQQPAQQSTQVQQAQIDKNKRLSSKTKEATGDLLWQIVELTDSLEIAMLRIQELEKVIKGGSIEKDKPE